MAQYFSFFLMFHINKTNILFRILHLNSTCSFSIRLPLLSLIDVNDDDVSSHRAIRLVFKMFNNQMLFRFFGMFSCVALSIFCQENLVDRN